MKKVVVIGGGIAGLLANWVFKNHSDVDVKVLENAKVGGDFLVGGLRYVHESERMESMLNDNRVVYTKYQVNGGIMLKGAISAYPAILKKFSPEQAQRIQFDHYRKTRKTEPSAADAGKSMNDPEAAGSRNALRVDAGAMIRALGARANVVCDKAVKIESNSPAPYVLGSSGMKHTYDFLITTIPMWILRGMVSFELPEALALKLNIVNVDVTRDPYSKWDYVYTPYTPENLIHRISPRDGGWAAEFNGDWVEPDTNLKLTSDLNFLFPQGWALDKVIKGLNGHLLPLELPAAYPKNMQPLGRFAVWDTRATADVVLESCWDLASAWGFKKRLGTYD